MEIEAKKPVGFACAYTPLPLINAAGLAHYRVFPDPASAGSAGGLLHENVCPHVKLILDRALGGNLPPLAGMVFMNSCDAMRRLADGWRKARPSDRVFLVDLPVRTDERSVAFFAGELERLANALSEWSGTKRDNDLILRSADLYNRLADKLAAARELAAAQRLEGGYGALQELYNMAATNPVEVAHARVTEALKTAGKAGTVTLKGVPVHLFGNVMHDPGMIALLESCGARIASEDLCTGSRMFQRIQINREAVFTSMADAILSRRPCARTFDPLKPGKIGSDTAAEAKRNGAKGAICHIMKFCDPYLARLPFISEALKKEGIPLLILEGDCSMRSMGQVRTRIEAFVEMLG